MNRYLNAKKSHECCMVCGSSENTPNALELIFSQQQDGSVCATYEVNHKHQGYSGLLHGGMTSTLLDAAMTHRLFMEGIQALTAELTVRFISPVSLGQTLMVCARLVGQRRGVYQLEAWLTDGPLRVARASAKFIAPSQSV
ncbi:TPA: PaaI family thioesterase [Yersinia enterocolitica]|nr:PaaI family thioesterase [Yersinia enterocolitica]HDL6662188.1 PaaI family thioesterase [Yersinia enterocolitica]HDL6666524.1 PaaI family thioesterase [Yersinia enterocolitica]HDL6713874.1 PaaI family thioesterase [Yersinia enterocolitica]HDL6757342.1 PaaI family thioesterase [Yersinia enterocolitica]